MLFSKIIKKTWQIIFFFLLLTLPVQNLITQTLVFKLELPEYIALYKEVLVVFLILLEAIIIFKRVFLERKTAAQTETHPLAHSQETHPLTPSQEGGQNPSTLQRGGENYVADSQQGEEDFQLEKSKLSFWQKYSWLFPLLIFITLNGLLIFSSFLNQTDFSVFLVGYRFELFWLGFFAFSLTFLAFLKKEKIDFFNQQFGILASKTLLAGYLLVVLVVVIQSLVGISNFNQFFRPEEAGENQVMAQTICHPIDFHLKICRLNGPFSSPNHFSGYLLFVLPFLLWFFISSLNFFFNKNILKISKDYSLSVLGKKKIWNLSFSLILLLANLAMLFFSYSRYSWLSVLLFAGLLDLALALEFGFKKGLLKNLQALKIYKVGLIFSLFISFFFGLFIINLDPSGFIDDLPENLKSITKPSSTTGHFRHFQASLDVFREAGTERQLWGFGSGSSGPAATNQYQEMDQNPIVKNHTKIAGRWGLLGFHLGIPENWFLQVLLNGGIFYLLLYLILIAIPYQIFYQELKTKDFTKLDFSRLFWFLPFHLIVFGNLLLHIWENQTVALYWTLTYLIIVSLKVDSIPAIKNTPPAPLKSTPA